MPNDPDTTSSAPQGDKPQKAPSAQDDWSWPRFWRNAAIIAGVVSLSVYVIVEGVVPNIVPKNFGVVKEGEIYRSGELTVAATRKVVRAHGIRTIVDLGAHEVGSPEERRAERTAEALGVTRHRIALFGDARGDPNRYAAALRILNDPDARPVLIHCAAGAQRTGCAVGMYRVIEDGMSIEEAIAEATDYRHDPEDNPLLTEMMLEWTDDVRRALETGETIEYDGPTRE